MFSGRHSFVHVGSATIWEISDGSQLMVNSTDHQSLQFFLTQAWAAIMTAVRPTWMVTLAQEVEQKYI
jgi:hypothetical protein